MYYSMKDNNVGGPSIIFNRYHEKEKSSIRKEQMRARGKESKPCKNVVGYDANALYLWAIMQDMPTGQYTRRLEEDGLKNGAVEKWRSNGWNGKRTVAVLVSDSSITTWRKELALVISPLTVFTLNHKRSFSFMVSCCFSVIS